MFINLYIVLYWHGDKTNYFATISIYTTNMSDTITNQFFILVNVHFLSKIMCYVRKRIHSSFSSVHLAWQYTGDTTFVTFPKQTSDAINPSEANKTVNVALPYVGPTCRGQGDACHALKSIIVYTYVAYYTGVQFDKLRQLTSYYSCYGYL